MHTSIGLEAECVRYVKTDSSQHLQWIAFQCRVLWNKQRDDTNENHRYMWHCALKVYGCTTCIGILMGQLLYTYRIFWAWFIAKTWGKTITMIFMFYNFVFRWYFLLHKHFLLFVIIGMSHTTDRLNSPFGGYIPSPRCQNDIDDKVIHQEQ